LNAAAWRQMKVDRYRKKKELASVLEVCLLGGRTDVPTRLIRFL
jgi:hypothetical protein